MNLKFINKRIVAIALAGVVLAPTAQALAAEAASVLGMPQQNKEVSFDQNALFSVAAEIKDANLNDAIKIESTDEIRLTNILTGKVFAVVGAEGYFPIKAKANEASEVVGKVYESSIINIVERTATWTKVSSGNVEGFIKTEYLLTGKAAEAKAKELLTAKYPEVDITTLNKEEIEACFSVGETAEEEIARLAAEEAARIAAEQARLAAEKAAAAENASAAASQAAADLEKVVDKIDDPAVKEEIKKEAEAAKESADKASESAQAAETSSGEAQASETKAEEAVQEAKRKGVYDSKMPKMSIKSKSSKKTSITIKWSKLSTKNRKKCTKIEIWLCPNTKFAKADTKIKTVSKTATSVTFKSLKKNKKYYFKIRTIKYVNGVKRVGKWSTRKYITTKKK
jgi:hypothetical protein